MSTPLKILLAGALLGLGLLVYLITGAPQQFRDVASLTGDATRGAYVLRMGGCVACHTDSKAENGFLAGGVAFPTPFGTYLSPNITSDAENGLGGWSQDDFINAIINGMSPDGRHYAPAFPYTSYSAMTDQDLVDLWAYLQTVPAQSMPNQTHDVTFPFNLNIATASWKTLFFEHKVIASNPDKSDAWNRGNYLVNGPGHCGECHSPRGALGNLDTNNAFTGSVINSDERVPGITSAQLQENGWTMDNIPFSLSFGMLPDGDFFGGSMGEVIEGSTKHLTEQDRRAMAEYLLDQ